MVLYCTLFLHFHHWIFWYLSYHSHNYKHENLKIMTKHIEVTSQKLTECSSEDIFVPIIVGRVMKFKLHSNL